VTGARAATCALLLLAASACSRQGAPCAAPTCGSGYECLASRCVPSGSAPIDRDTDRVVLEPSGVAVGGSRGGAAPPSATLGGKGAPSETLYLRFAPTWRSPAEIVGAFLVMASAPEAPPSKAETRLQVWAIGGPWSPERIAEGVRPSLELPRAEGVAIPSPPGLVRIDVTRLARALAARPGDHGIAVLAPEARGPGLTVLTGTTGNPPRLELYLRRARPRAGAW
jgi:hypothetical protein